MNKEIKSEQLERQISMFGMTQEKLRAKVDSHIKEGFMTSGSLAVSILSDVQELMSMGYNEDARQLINQSKWIIHNYCSSR